MFKKFFCILVVLVLHFSTQSFSQILFTVKLDGSQETPSVTTTGVGTAWAVLNPDMTKLTFRVTYAQLQSGFTASHFHSGAVGIAGPVVHPITFSGNTASGEWTALPDSIIAKLFKREIYVNIHTSGNPGGEIRGQLIPADGIGFTAALDGSQQNPPVTTNASGTAWAVLQNNGTEVTNSVTVAGLSSTLTASHFHNGAVGVNGPVIQAITFTDSTANGTWNGFTDNIMTELLKGNMYINIHTTNNGGGEIRGQLIHQGEIMVRASLDGTQENPAVVTNAKATLWGIFSSDLSSLTFNVTYANLSSAFTASHFHLGADGVNGPVIHPIAFSGNNASGVWSSLADSIVRHIIKGNVYINIHSSINPGGEIRGQVWVTEGIGFNATLDGSQQNPPISTNAKGTAWLAYGDNLVAGIGAGEGLFYQITIAGLSSNLTASHFHNGAVGINGPVIQAIIFSDSTVAGVWSGISDANLALVIKGNTYINVHTSTNPGGEIRGQVMFTNIVSGNIPVELISFSASIKDNSITLSWTTATEINNRGFEIQRQNENNTWLTIGFVQGKGTTTEVQSYSFIDENLTSGKYSYRFKQVDFDGRFEYSNVVNINIGSPLSFELSQNYPNPFNPTTTINFTLPEKTNVSLKVYNILGSQVAEVLNEVKDAGSYSVNFKAQGLSSGIYIYKISTGSGKEISRKMTLLK